MPDQLRIHFATGTGVVRRGKKIRPPDAPPGVGSPSTLPGGRLRTDAEHYQPYYSIFSVRKCGRFVRFCAPGLARFTRRRRTVISSSRIGANWCIIYSVTGNTLDQRCWLCSFLSAATMSIQSSAPTVHDSDCLGILGLGVKVPSMSASDLSMEALEGAIRQALGSWDDLADDDQSILDSLLLVQQERSKLRTGPARWRAAKPRTIYYWGPWRNWPKKMRRKPGF